VIIKTKIKNPKKSEKKIIRTVCNINVKSLLSLLKLSIKSPNPQTEG